MAIETSVETIRSDHKVVLIKIPRSAPADGDATALLEATSKWWVVSESRRDGGPASPEYALAVNRGRIVIAYRIVGWQRAPSGHRWGFTGNLSDELTALYRGMDVTRYFPPGAANPLRYVNCLSTTSSSTGDPAAKVVEDKRAELAEAVRRLNAEPLTHLMLGHRELFHSNLLAWFFQSMPEAADRVFRPLTTASSGASRAARMVQREKKSLDLWFSWPDRRPLVLENKVFSLPDEEQLASYASITEAGNESPALWLLSLTDPSWADDRKVIAGHEWLWLSYRDLASRIRVALRDADASYEHQTMRHYADVVDLLSDLVEQVVVTDSSEPVAMPLDVHTALGDDRLASAMAKLRARSVAHRLSLALREAGVDQSIVESGLTRTHPLISWFRRVDNRAPGARAGWQLQEGQFRLALITPHLKGTDPARRAARSEFAKANEDLFDFTEIDEILGTSGSPVQPTQLGSSLGFNRFDPDFVYRYKAAHHLTVVQLEAAAIAIARRIDTGKTT